MNRNILEIGIVGAGTMGSGIAISAAMSGYRVTLFDAEPKAAAAGHARIDGYIDSAVGKGRLSESAGASAKQLVSAGSDFGRLGAVDLVIEAVFENLALKCEVFSRLGAACRPSAILATNTSTLNVDAIAEASGRAADVVGMHFFSPAHVMRLVEIVRGRRTAPGVIASVLDVSKRMGKVGIVVGNCFGFVGNRMLYAYGREKELLMLEGATPEQIDRALEAFGMAMGPNAVGDLAGLDIGYKARREWRDKPDDPRFYRISDLLVERGRLGQKSGRGFYRYEAGARRGTPDAEVIDMIRAEASRLGMPQRDITDEEIVERCILALINEGARLIDEGVAESREDIDAIWCNGYGFPRARGGPMAYADALGIERVLERLASYRARFGDRYWAPAAALGMRGAAERG